MNTNNNFYCLRINQSISSNILSIELYKWIKKINPKKNIQLLDVDKFILIPFKNKEANVYCSFPFHRLVFLSFLIAFFFSFFRRKIRFFLFTRGAIIQNKNFLSFLIKFLFWHVYAFISNYIEIRLFCSSYYEIYKISSKILIPYKFKFNLIYDHISSYNFLKISEFKFKNKYLFNKNIKLLLASRYSWEKGINETMALLSKLTDDELNNLEISIIGCNLDLRNKYPNLVEKIRFIDFTERENILFEMDKADIFLAPSKSESYCWAVVEALQMGCKVLVTSSSPWRFINDNEYIKPINPLLKKTTPKQFLLLLREMNNKPRKNFSFEELIKILEDSDLNWKKFLKKGLIINY